MLQLKAKVIDIHICFPFFILALLAALDGGMRDIFEACSDEADVQEFIRIFPAGLPLLVPGALVLRVTVAIVHRVQPLLAFGPALLAVKTGNAFEAAGAIGLELAASDGRGFCVLPEVFVALISRQLTQRKPRRVIASIRLPTHSCLLRVEASHASRQLRPKL